MPELRQNIITGDWVVVAPERAKRPRDFVIPKSVKIADKSKCPFCVGTDGYKANEKIRMHTAPHVYVIENRYPAFVMDDTEKSVRSFYPESGFYRARASVGDHEVIVVEDHDTPLFKIPKLILNEMMEVIRSRYIWMKEHEKVVSIMPIYNHGAEAGASIDHPHAQIFASGIVSNTVGREIEGADTYYGVAGNCVYCDMIAHEQMEKVRIVFENDKFIAINFYASRFPFETWILPKKHESQFELTTRESMTEFSDALWEVLRMIDKTLENPPLNFFVHTLPTIIEASASFHWHLEIVPRVSRYGGFELGSEVIINTMPPEEATHYLKG
ncbi:MAG: galactose-1-phosphate uridylyltransferase [Candidatus Berkelbacteria bacterium]